jgi:hypothetical protein
MMLTVVKLDGKDFEKYPTLGISAGMNWKLVSLIFAETEQWDRIGF